MTNPDTPAARERVAIADALEPFIRWGAALNPDLPDDCTVLAGPSHMWEEKITAGQFRILAALAPQWRAIDRTYRAALQDIADAEAIPNDAVAFVWCREVARTALAAPTAEEPAAEGEGL